MARPPPANEDIAMLDKQMKPANGRPGPVARGRAALMLTTVLMAAWFALAGSAVAGENKEPPVAKVSEAEAKKTALDQFPGEATDVKIERKLGKNVYVVEIQTKDKGEMDVFVDIESGQIVGTD